MGVFNQSWGCTGQHPLQQGYFGNLHEQGYVIYKHYCNPSLSDNGLLVAHSHRHRHVYSQPFQPFQIEQVPTLIPEQVQKSSQALEFLGTIQIQYLKGTINLGSPIESKHLKNIFIIKKINKKKEEKNVPFVSMENLVLGVFLWSTKKILLILRECFLGFFFIFAKQLYLIAS